MACVKQRAKWDEVVETKVRNERNRSNENLHQLSSQKNGGTGKIWWWQNVEEICGHGMKIREVKLLSYYTGMVTTD